MKPATSNTPCRLKLVCGSSADRKLAQGRYYHRDLVAIAAARQTYNLTPITHGGRGFLGRTIRLLNPKAALSSTSKLGDFLFLSIRHILEKLIHREGGCCGCFRNETSRKIEHTIFLFCFQNHGNAEE